MKDKLVGNITIGSDKFSRWSKTQRTRKKGQKTRKFLTTEGIHHLKTDTNRIYIKRRNGGCGLVELESAAST
jgi:hypothetical protein